MKLSVAHAILAATVATASARLFPKNNEARKLQAPEEDVVACTMEYAPGEYLCCSIIFLL